MAIYTLHCKKCQAESTKRMNMDDTIPQKCDSINHNGCDGELVKIITGSQFALKGAGWFRDGYFKQK